MAFTKLFVAAVAVFALATSVAAAPVAKAWDESKFEPYDTYHARYIALKCQDKHNTKFFDTCCGPLAHGQALSTRPAECKPTTTSSTQDDDGEDCDDEGDEGATTLNPTTTTKAATTTTKKATTTTTKKTTTTTKPATTTKAASGATHTGHGTWYTQNGVAGACGKKHSDSDLIGAMNFHLYGNVDKVSSTCGKKVLITNTKNGKQVTITLADACPSCNGSGDIDLSLGAFKKLDALDTGLINIKWQYV
ncbi:hypothetical protein M407DRAFT_184229 [Tulasnella calospora MUT 4182]|uniref:RlpA-like protein double-psi beta-barrel domain-containing protein n=1 Tax=Tulasnella calospora MUT 4182 TaxID=1051891 RepID=A0A0C3QMP8_9AGAM|nr:hypothetical protein M407DRAFT_184229 [Tulasnella calospora MUT 4182]